MSGELVTDAHPGPGPTGVEAQPRARRSAGSRVLSATGFACAALAFALPFGTVSSCEGEEVSFTGAQLATLSVPPDESSGGTLHAEVEGNAGALAVVVLLAAVLGLGGAIAGLRRGGILASVGLVGAQLLGMAILLTGSAGGTPLLGFWLALLSLAVAGLVHLVEAVRARQRSGRRVWGYALARCALALSPMLAVIVLIAIAVLASA